MHRCVVEEALQEGAIVTEICAAKIIPSVKTTFELDRTDAADDGACILASPSKAVGSFPITAV